MTGDFPPFCNAFFAKRTIFEYIIIVSQVQISLNKILSFIIKEICHDKINSKNTYIIKIQGIEMNNLTTVEKVKIEEGVWQILVSEHLN